ncbi:CS1-pili formation C-terminal domain-containing protein [Cedecea neteri]|nr:CS1-pili formation C-terminal domain-containing protein [Cedecea neteri]
MSFLRPLTGSLLLISSTNALAQPVTLVSQAASMPDDFRSHFFNAPLSARVMLDNRVLGDAMIMVTEDNRARIIHFTDSGDSEYGEAERQRWLKSFSNFVTLGECSQHDCPPGLLAADYSLSDARLVLLTQQPGNEKGNYWYALPGGGDSGLLLNNQLNLSGSQKQSTMSWNGGLEAALGSWTVTSQFQQDQTRSDGQGSYSRHAMTSLYAQREFQQHFLRAGLFTPDSQGLLRQPYTPGNGISTLAGMMAGSSDALLKGGDIPALYPLYVTANREGVAEIYRDGTLLNSQPVQPGLQMLDTVPLPSGIYEVEIRIMEDGRESSRVTETINKPTRWRTPGQRLRYNLFAGQQQTLWNSDKRDNEGDLAAGASVNWLLHPLATVGMAVQKTGKERQTGVSLDWQAAEPVQIYGNVWRSNITGYGFDTQGIWTHAQGNVALSHSRSWYRSEDEPYRYTTRPSIDHSSTLSTTWRFNSENSLNARLTHRSRNNGIGADVGFNTRTTLAGNAINWRLAAFDRPYGNTSSLRNRGVSLSASFALGGEKRSGNISLGSRTDSNGSRDLYTSASVNQTWDKGPVKMTTATVTADRHGAGFSTYNQFDTPVLAGSFWGQSSTLNSSLSGGINTGSLLAIGGGHAVMSKQAANYQGGGMIIDVSSDDKNAELVALYPGGAAPLKPGRNFIPVDAWKPGTVQIDFPGTEAPALKVEPEYLNYQHIRGGVSAHTVKVMKTMTVMGRLVDGDGHALGGAHVVNHAGRTVTEPDGLFTLEVHENNPVLAVEHRSISQCEIRLNPTTQKTQAEIIFLGNLTCDGLPLAGNTEAASRTAANNKDI